MAKAPESLDLSTYDATDKSLDRDCTTLSRHVLQQLQSFSPDAQDLSALMNRIALAGKLIARRMSRAGLMEGVLGFTGEVNVQGGRSRIYWGSECAGRIRQKDGCLCQ